MKSIRFLKIGVLLAAGVCSLAAVRPAFSQSRKATLLEQFLAFRIDYDGMTLESCEAELKAGYDAIFSYTPDPFVIAELKADPTSAVNLSRDAFYTRVFLREKTARLIGTPDHANALHNRCLSAAKNFNRALRFAEETLSALVRGAPIRVPKKEELTRNFEGGEPYLWINPKFADFKGVESLREGDVLMSRGNQSVSALIARLPDDDSQFSHQALVARDPKTKQLVVLEAHIQVGSTISPIEKYVEANDGRVVVFRHPDEFLAMNASELMFDRLTQRRHDYNFHMDMENHRELFCSQVIREAFLMATQNRMQLPWFPSSFKPKNTYLLDIMQIAPQRTYAPSDIEWDTRFELVAEWKELDRVWMMQIHDAVLVKMLEWIELHEYRFFEGITAKIATHAGYRLRHWKLTGWLLAKNMPLNMPKETLQLVTIYHQVATNLFRIMTEASEKVEAARGFPLMYPELLVELEKFRVEDERLYLAWQKVIAQGNCNRMLTKQLDKIGDTPKMHEYFRKET